MDTRDLFHNLTWRVEIDQSFVNPHFIAIPSLGTLTVGSLPRGDFEDFSRQSDGSLDFEILVLGPGNQICADLFDVLDMARGQGNTDSVDLSRGLGLLFFFSSFSD